MSQPRPHTDTARYLIDHASLSKAQIDAMSAAEMAAYLTARGINVPGLKTDIQALQARLAGQAALAQARRERLARAAPPPPDLSALSQEEMVAALVGKFGRLEDIPLAARNFRLMQRGDWESLYTDYILRQP